MTSEPDVRKLAQDQLVFPVNLLTFSGLITSAIGLILLAFGIWPAFNGAPLNAEVVARMILGLILTLWGLIVCYGSSGMQNLSSYNWAMATGVMGILPFLVGFYVLLVLMNAKVKAGFEIAAFDSTNDEHRVN